MTSEQRDPREAVEPVDILEVLLLASPAAEGIVRALLNDAIQEIRTLRARLDAADPLRAILPEVVDAFYKIATLTDPRRPLSTDPQTVADVWEITRAALARIREIHPTTGGTDDG